MSTSLSEKRIAAENVTQDVGNTTDETTLFTGTVPGGILGSNGMLRFTALITGIQTSGSPIDLTLNAKMGAVAPAPVVISVPSGSAYRIVLLYFIGATGSGAVSHHFSGVILPGPDTLKQEASFGSGGFDNTVDQTFTLTAAWATAPGNVQSVRMRYAPLEIVGAA